MDYFYLHYRQDGFTTIGRLNPNDLAGNKMWTQSAVQFFPSDILNFCVTLSSDKALFCKEVFSTETSNPNSNAYLTGADKREIISTKMELVSSGTMERHVGGLEDYQPIYYAFLKNLECILSDYHEAKNACDLNVPFYYLLKPEQINFINKEGEKEFKSHFFKEINTKK